MIRRVWGANVDEDRADVPVDEPSEPVDQPDVPAPDADLFAGLGDEPAPRRRRRTLAVAAALVLVLAAAYVALLWVWADRVPPGTIVAGVDIGALDAGDAVVTLQDALDTTATEPFPVSAGERRTNLDPVAAGLSLDARATVESVTGFDLAPAALWRHVFGHGPVAPVTTVDDEALGTALDAVADALATAPVDGTVAFVDGVAHGTSPEDGLEVDRAAAEAVLRETWLTAARPLELPSVVVPPTITQAAVDAAIVEVARPIASGPVSVAVAGQLAALPPSLLTSATIFVPEGDRLVARMAGEPLRETLLARTTDLVTEPQDARFEFVDGVPTVVAGDPGTDVDPDELAAAVVAAAVSDNRTAPLTLTWIDPEESAADLRALGVVEKVAEFSTWVTADTDRNHNLTLAGDRITGTLLRPGDTFSLVDTVGPITAENGYRGAPVVVEGRLTDGVGGGMSQVATTTYNAAFLAGLEDVEHTPHSYWFSRYPEGREATVYEGVLDLRFRNNTPHGVLMQAWLEGGEFHVAVWSSRYWEVEEWTSGRSGVTPTRTVYDTSASCRPQASGNSGFTVTVHRTLRLDGVEQESQEWTWRYRPQNAVVCGPEPVPEPEPAPPEQ